MEKRVKDRRGDQYMDHRRGQREEISERGAAEVWGKSPDRRDSDTEAHSEVEDVQMVEVKLEDDCKNVTSTVCSPATRSVLDVEIGGWVTQ